MSKLEIGGWCPIGKSISVSVAVRACACVRAKLCAGVRQMFLLGLGPPSRSLWGSGPGRAARALPGGRAVSRAEKKVLFFRNLIASGHSATPEVCFCRVFVPKIGCFFFIEHEFF